MKDVETAESTATSPIVANVLGIRQLVLYVHVFYYMFYGY